MRVIQEWNRNVQIHFGNIQACKEFRFYIIGNDPVLNEIENLRHEYMAQVSILHESLNALAVITGIMFLFEFQTQGLLVCLRRTFQPILSEHFNAKHGLVHVNVWGTSMTTGLVCF
jgi:hypothetical protein